MNAKTVLSKVNPRKLTSNTQKVAWKLLTAGGQWVTKTELDRVASSSTSRVRDLRKATYGNFVVECLPATALKRTAKPNLFCYRIRPTTVSAAKVSAVFRV